MGNCIIGRSGDILLPSLARPLRVINDNDTVVLRGNVQPNARPNSTLEQRIQLQMDKIVLFLQIPPDKQAELERLLAEQHDPASPNFQHWLTPEEFGKRFGPDPEDLTQ